MCLLLCAEVCLHVCKCEHVHACVRVCVCEKEKSMYVLVGLMCLCLYLSHVHICVCVCVCVCVCNGVFDKMCTYVRRSLYASHSAAAFAAHTATVIRRKGEP